jgi:hypothetical protein
LAAFLFLANCVSANSFSRITVKFSYIPSTVNSFTLARTTAKGVREDCKLVCFLMPVLLEPPLFMLCGFRQWSRLMTVHANNTTI